jgi:GNAT superfamily N-acetyltransferase
MCPQASRPATSRTWDDRHLQASFRKHWRRRGYCRFADTVFVERAVSQNTDPSPSATGEPVSVRTLTAATRSEIEALAALFDKYRAHYGEASSSSKAIGWLEQNLGTRLRAFVAEDSGRFVGFAITMDVPASLRLAYFWQIRDLFVLSTHRRRGVGRGLLRAVRAAANASGALRLVVQTEEDNDPALRLYTDSGYTPINGYRSLMLPIRPENAERSQTGR